MQEKFKRNCTDIHPLTAPFFPASYTKPDKWPRALIRVFIVVFYKWALGRKRWKGKSWLSGF